MRFLERYRETIFALLRFVTGVLFACHGAQKLFGVFGGPQSTGSPLMLAAGIIEFGAGVLVAIGLLTAFAAFLASGEMMVAYFAGYAWARWRERRRKIETDKGRPEVGPAPIVSVAERSAVAVTVESPSALLLTLAPNDMPGLILGHAA